MSTAVCCIFECKITFIDGKEKMYFPTYKEVSDTLAIADSFSIKGYLQEKYPDAKLIEVIDVHYFRTQQDYEDYLKSI